MSIEGEPQYTASSSGLTYQPAGMTHYEPTDPGINTTSKFRAEKNRSALLKAQWADYQKRFAPIEDELIGQIGNADYYASQVNNATDAVADAYARQPGIHQRDMARYGVTTDADQSADQARQYGLNAAAATTQAANQTRANLKRRDIDIMGGGLVPNDPTKQSGGR